MANASMRWLVCVSAVMVASCAGSAADCPATDASMSELDASMEELDAPLEDASTASSTVFVDGEALTFEVACVGGETDPLHVTLANAGSEPVPIRARLEGAGASELAIVSGEGCGAELGARRTCTVSVVARAIDGSGDIVGLLVLDVGAEHVEVPISAARAYCDAGSVMPSPVGFGDLVVGGRSAPASFEARNLGDGISPPIDAVMLRGLDASQFEIVRDGCLGHALVPGARCLVDVVYAPSTPGVHAASLWIEGFGLGAASLSGRAVPP
jgi:hypothetical protein